VLTTVNLAKLDEPKMDHCDVVKSEDRISRKSKNVAGSKKHANAASCMF